MPLLDLILTYDCNLACDYCTITTEMRARSLSTAAVVDALRRGRALAYDAVSFSGGEPTIRSDLLGLVRAARSLGYSDIKVQSNGLLFAHGPNIDRIVAAGANRFHVSIHTPDASAYDALVRREGAYASMVAGVDALVARRVRFTADVILNTDTYRKLPDAVRWLHARGVRSVDLWFVSLTDGNRDNVASMPRMTETLPQVHEALAFARTHDMHARSLHIPRCLLGDDVAHAWDPAAGGVMVVTPDATFTLESSKLAGHTHVPACDGCVHRVVCAGVRPDYLERFGDEEIARARGQGAQIAARRSLGIVP